MTEFEQARAWRQSHNLSQKKLGELLGYSIEAICWFEKGMVPPNRGDGDRRIKPHIWQRYKLACSGLDMELNEGKWNWGQK